MAPHEQRLLQALTDLTHQIDINDYRDSLGHDAKRNAAYLRAQAVVRDFGVTHEDICEALDLCDDDLTPAVKHLSERGASRLH